MGCKVRAFIRYNSRRDPGLLRFLPEDTRRRIDFIFGDLRDLHAVNDAMLGTEIVMHLGALIDIPYSYYRPAEVVETNIIGTLNVLLAARESGVKRIIHTSSSEVYGTAQHVPISEDHPLQGQSPYSASKIGADKLAESFYRSYNTPVVTIRPFNTYGPRQSTRAVVPTIITQALTSDVIQLGTLHTRRDLTYVSDTVDGLIKAAISPSIEGQTINLGSGNDISIQELVTQITSLIGQAKPIHIDASRLRPEKSEVQRLLSDNHRAKELLGWQPQVTLHEGLQKTIDWIRENLDFYKPSQSHF